MILSGFLTQRRVGPSLAVAALIVAAMAAVPQRAARADDAHCSSHASGAARAHDGHAPTAAAPTVRTAEVTARATAGGGASSDCDHCGTSGCMTGVHCGTGTAAGAASVTFVGTSGGREQGQQGPAGPPASHTNQPPTPPPDSTPHVR